MSKFSPRGLLCNDVASTEIYTLVRGHLQMTTHFLFQFAV
jgi:hypothetical protein